MRGNSHVRFWSGGGVGDRPADRNGADTAIATVGGVGEPAMGVDGSGTEPGPPRGSRKR